MIRIYVYAIELLRGLKSERGQDLAEYAVITGSIAIAVLAAALVLGLAFSGWFGDMATWVGNLGPIQNLPG